MHEALQENFSLRPKYRFHVNPRNSVHNNFMMLTSNLSEVAEGLDKLRKNPRFVMRFMCVCVCVVYSSFKVNRFPPLFLLENLIVSMTIYNLVKKITH